MSDSQALVFGLIVHDSLVLIEANLLILGVVPSSEEDSLTAMRLGDGDFI